ncbi:receptor for retinol uptake STRA6 [Pleurodeles waltl]|uniref:receptor for retinol uptake STRA6 n=1 Tax=Pleurodeles waltl TaxID=8319 RepID=UPI0037096A7F
MSVDGSEPANWSVEEEKNYDDWYLDEPAAPTKPAHEIILPCDPTVPDQLYHLILAPLSLAVLLTLSVLVKRRRLCKGWFNGVPGLLSPVNFLGQDGQKAGAAAVFGVLFCSLCRLVLDPNPLPFLTDSSLQYREYWKILALLYYPTLYYPLLACMSVRHGAGYFLGGILSWLHCGILIWQKAQCPEAPKFHRYYSLLSALPQIACFLLLTLLYPAWLLKKCKEDKKSKCDEVTESSYCLEYLQTLLKKKKKSSSQLNDCFPSQSWSSLNSYLYSPQQGFHLPLKLILSSTVGGICLYQVALLLLVVFLPTVQKIRAAIDMDAVLMLAGFGINFTQDREEAIILLKYYLWALEVCYVSALVLSCALTVCMLVRSLVLHRSNLKALYRGATSEVFLHDQRLRPSRSAIFCWMSFTSYQAALTCIGLLLQQLVFFICNIVITFLVIIPVVYGKNLLLFKILKTMWPFWVMVLLALILQHLCARFAFLQMSSTTRELNNRRALYMLTYLLFPINMLMGFLMGVWRIVISALFNIIHMCRLDISLLHRSVETFDPGYRIYYHFLKIEVSQSHPMMRTFCFLLMQPSTLGRPARTKNGDVEEGIQLMQSKTPLTKGVNSRQSRTRWWLAYTLLNNPSLAALRTARLVAVTPAPNGTPVMSPS